MASGLEDDLEPRFAQDRHDRLRVIRGGGNRVAVIRHAEAAADIEVLDGRPVKGQLAREIGERGRAAGERLHFVVCDPTCACTPTICTFGRPRCCAQSARTSLIAMPNLLVLRPVEICGCVCASTSGLTRIAIRVRVFRSRDSASMRSISPGDSTLMLRTPRSIA